MARRFQVRFRAHGEEASGRKTIRLTLSVRARDCFLEFVRAPANLDRLEHTGFPQISEGLQSRSLDCNSPA